MLPTRINLLSPQKPEYLKRMMRIQFLKSMLELVLFMVCVIALTFVAGWKLLDGHVKKISVLVTTVSKQHEETNNRVNTVNTILKQVYTIQDSYILWTPLLEQVIAGIPEDVHLTELTMRPGEKGVILRGTADTRQALLTLQEKLLAMTFLRDVEIPLSDLVQKDHVTFSISAALVLGETPKNTNP